MAAIQIAVRREVQSAVAKEVEAAVSRAISVAAPSIPPVISSTTVSTAARGISCYTFTFLALSPPQTCCNYACVYVLASLSPPAAWESKISITFQFASLLLFEFVVLGGPGAAGCSTPLIVSWVKHVPNTFLS